VHNRGNSYDGGAPASTRVQHQRSGCRHVQHDELPGRVQREPDDARSLYALLTGRVTSITGTARLDAETGKYVYLGDTEQKARQFSIAAYASDSWRVTPTLTLNAGLRWDVQLPFVPVTQTYSTIHAGGPVRHLGHRFRSRRPRLQLFQPGNVGGKAQPQYYPFTCRHQGLQHNYDEHRLQRRLRVASERAGAASSARSSAAPIRPRIRAGYSMTYNVERFDRFTGIAGANPGGTTSPATRNATTLLPGVPG
jgi:hypothetical protein